MRMSFAGGQQRGAVKTPADFEAARKNAADELDKPQQLLPANLRLASPQTMRQERKEGAGHGHMGKVHTSAVWNIKSCRRVIDVFGEILPSKCGARRQKN